MVTPESSVDPIGDFFACTFTVYNERNEPHYCGRRCVAVYVGPLGRLPRCRVHERVLKRSADYRAVQL